MRAATIARNYAEALFALGEESGRGEQYLDLLEGLAAAVDASERARAVLMSPKVTRTRKAEILAAAVPGAPKELALFLQAVVKRGRQLLLGEIANEYAVHNSVESCHRNPASLPRVKVSMYLRRSTPGARAIVPSVIASSNAAITGRRLNHSGCGARNPTFFSRQAMSLGSNEAIESRRIRFVHPFPMMSSSGSEKMNVTRR